MKTVIIRCASVATAIALVVVAVSCGNSSSPAEPPATPPSVSGVSKTVVSPGDTLVVSGSNFASPASANRVTFTNPLGISTPFAGNSTSLTILVDQDATTGPITVKSNGLSATGPSVDVRRGIGDFFVFGGLGDNYPLSLPNPTVNTSYLVISIATNPTLQYSTDASYTIQSQAAAPAAAARTAGERAVPAVMDANTAFEAWRWDQTRRMLDQLGPQKEPAPRVDMSATAAPQEFRQFYVLDDPSAPTVTDPKYYTHVTAELRYTGTRCLVYADVDTFSTGNFSTDDLRTIGQAFDNSIDATNIQYFGSYSDIDGNGKVIILITPVVDRMALPGGGGFIAGFFLSIDLIANAPAGTSNHGEIFYLLAADPNGQSGSGHVFPVDATRDLNISTTAHEHEHMISFSHRIFHEGGVVQETWLEEGMAHMAEDLNGFDSQNMARANIYLNNPGDISLENTFAPLAQRGGMYLFLRLMADRYGTGILKQIVQSRCSGRDCLTNVTGTEFYDLVAEFLAALYLSGKGITADPRFEYQSIDLSNFNPVSYQSRVAGASLVAGVVKKTSGDFYVFSGTLNTTSKFTFFDDLGTGRIRNAIVRVQ